MKYRPVTKILVSLAMGDSPVRIGTLASVKRSIYFEYDRSFLESGIEISPFRLPLKAGKFQAKPDPFDDILRATLTLTRNMKEVEKMFRLASFNVFAMNRDDHAKNFTFLMDENGGWRVNPAYDLTYSRGPGGEQSTVYASKNRFYSLATETES